MNRQYSTMFRGDLNGRLQVQINMHRKNTRAQHVQVFTFWFQMTDFAQFVIKTLESQTDKNTCGTVIFSKED